MTTEKKNKQNKTKKTSKKYKMLACPDNGFNKTLKNVFKTIKVDK